MGSPSWIVILVTFVLEIIAFGLALGAMTRRSTGTEFDQVTVAIRFINALEISSCTVYNRQTFSTTVSMRICRIWTAVGGMFLFGIVRTPYLFGALAQHSHILDGNFADCVLFRASVDIAATIAPNLVDEYCQYSSDVATGLAAGAIIFLFFGQAVIMGVTGCFCCGSGSYKGRARACAILAFLLAWFSFVVAELCLIVGAALNKVHTTTHFTFNDYGNTLTCKEVRKSVFAAGAAFTFLTLFFGEIYYWALAKASDGSWEQSYKNGAPTISMTAYP